MNNLVIPDIVDIIKNSKLVDEYEIIKELEETIIDLYDKNTTSDLFKNPLLLLHELTENNDVNIKLFDVFDLSRYKIDEKIIKNLENIVFTGSIIRSVFIDNTKINDNLIRQELFVNLINNININDIIDNTYIELSDLYYKKTDDFIIYINKQKFKNISEIILSNYNLKRIGYHNNKIYVSSMFIADYNKFYDTINSDLVDPIFNTKIDIFDVFTHINRKDNTIFDYIYKKNFTEFKQKKIIKYDVFNKDKYTPIEYSLYLYINEQNDIIKSQLKLIILDLLEQSFQRPCIFYAYLLDLEEIDNELYNIILNSPKSKLFHEIKKESEISIKNIQDINNLILKYFIIKNNSTDFYNYLRYRNTEDKNIRIDIDIFNYIIQYDPKSIIIHGIKNNYFSERTKYKIILWTQNLDYFNLFEDEFNIQTSIGYINEIINNCFIKSFYFLYKIDNTIINVVDDDNNNILHNINQKNKYADMIKIILKLNDSLLFKKNKHGEIPIMTHIKSKNMDIVHILIEYIIESNNETLFEIIDNNKDNILHYLCKHYDDNNMNIIRKICVLKPEIINNQNKNFETPIILAAQNKCEDIIYFLKGINCDMNLIDIYGNSVYHYICLNELCIGMAIENKENMFGYKPSAYCKISLNYYYFV
jgi:hypothetical protein